MVGTIDAGVASEDRGKLPIARSGLITVNIQSDAQRLFIQHPDQRLFIYQVATGGVDKDRSGMQLFKEFRINHTPSFRDGRQVKT